MASSNSYRRKAEKYKRVILCYESLLSNELACLISDMRRESDAESRKYLANRVDSIQQGLFTEIKSLRGF